MGKDVHLQDPIAVALDGRDLDALRDVARLVAPHVGVFKIGVTTFASGGPDLVRELASVKPVFLDLKLHDIPAQVEGAVAAIADLGAAMTTVHASGGVEMVKAATAAAGDDLMVLAVTVLTSLDDAALLDLGNSAGAESSVATLADAALRGGADGLVCSPLEVRSLRDRHGERTDGGPFLVTPGIRPTGADTRDQRRTTGPREALDAGADLLVIGRPITAAGDPVAAAAAIQEEIAR